MRLLMRKDFYAKFNWKHLNDTLVFFKIVKQASNEGYMWKDVCIGEWRSQLLAGERVAINFGMYKAS